MGFLFAQSCEIYLARNTKSSSSSVSPVSALDFWGVGVSMGGCIWDLFGDK